MPNTDSNSHLPSGVPVTGDDELTGIVQAESTDEALTIAANNVACPPPAFLWEDAADASSDPDVFRLDDVDDLPQVA
jgi:hypothetical protein